MTDQWPRYEVFKQDRPDGPHRNVGSVHAPDAELAVLNARDVFARRPACHSLWVIPAEAIMARTAEELATESEEPADGEVRSQQYSVFSKQSQRQTMTYVDYMGQVEARSAAEALRLAARAADPPAAVWWAAPTAAIVRSDEEVAAGFEAATSKRFRLPNQYHTVFTMRQLRRAQDEEEAE
ncbi:phenylacetic acid degradation protein [Promineifilum sp.]|uniref:phenylacetic acid degradation protein n=1 Tax=Promineifilum sp. TaxID=2664178 RepID=UPI0035B498E1